MHLSYWLVVIAVAVIYEDDRVAVPLLSNRMVEPVVVATATAAATNAVAYVWIGWHVIDARECGPAADVVTAVIAMPIR